MDITLDKVQEGKYIRKKLKKWRSTGQLLNNNRDFELEFLEPPSPFSAVEMVKLFLSHVKKDGLSDGNYHVVLLYHGDDEQMYFNNLFYKFYFFI